MNEELTSFEQEIESLFEQEILEDVDVAQQQAEADAKWSKFQKGE